MVQQGIGLARGDIVDIDSDDEPKAEPPSLKVMMEACRLLEENSVVVCTEGALEVVKSLRRYPIPRPSEQSRLSIPSTTASEEVGAGDDSEGEDSETRPQRQRTTRSVLSVSICSMRTVRR